MAERTYVNTKMVTVVTYAIENINILNPLKNGVQVTLRTALVALVLNAIPGNHCL
jgi:hypothetical protein